MSDVPWREGVQDALGAEGATLCLVLWQGARGGARQKEGGQMMDRAARGAALRRYADYAARRKAIDAVLASMDEGGWKGEGLTREEVAEVQAAGFAAARAVVQRWREEALAQQESALDEMEEVQTAASMVTQS